MLTIFGTPIGGGIVIGRACVIDSRMLDVPRYRITEELVGAQQSRISLAVSAVTRELEAIAAELPADAPGEARALVEVHAMILNDPALIDAAMDQVASDLVNAEWAVADCAGEIAQQFRELEDSYLSERSRDVEQVSERLLKALAGEHLAVPRQGPNEPLVFVAHDIAPADMIQMRGALGFVIEKGGANSHTAILARSMNVATVIGAQHAGRLIRDDDTVIIDAEAGALIVAPDEWVLNEYRDRRQAADLESQKLLRLAHVPAVTLDGRGITLMANIETPDEAEAAVAVGAAGVGLFRSEFLFLNRPSLPDEQEQYESYASAVQAMGGRPVTIRTIDVGQDKTLPGQGHTGETSPLGQRAIRYSLAEPEMFLLQLRAILRASAHGPVRILLPMLSHAQQIDLVQTLVERARQQLRERGQACADHVPIGGMIEIPAAALSAKWFAQRLDFLSIGTNDLVQYTLAIDRTDSSVAYLYDEFHPAVLQLIAMTIRAAHKAGKSVSVCGEMAGEVRACALLLGMGLTEFSMPPNGLLRIKREILRSDVSRLEPRVRQLLATDDPMQFAAAVDRLARMPDPPHDSEPEVTVAPAPAQSHTTLAMTRAAARNPGPSRQREQE